MIAVALISGGLDSALAVKILQHQGIEVIGSNFTSPFSKPASSKLVKSLDIEVKDIPLKRDYLSVLKNPKFGFGKNFNPCIDCHIYMLKKAKSIMKKLNAVVVVTGEVLGQRPMSQHRTSLNSVEQESGLTGNLLRPLSAKLLDETIAEKNGLVKRDKLYAISGRSRKEQLKLAKKFKLIGFNQPAGGCLLTDPNFTKRFKDLRSHRELTFDNFRLLKFGRYFRLSSKLKFVLGRNELQNKELEDTAKKQDYIFMTLDIPGPVAIARGVLKDSDMFNLAASIVASYADNKGQAVEVTYFQKKSSKKKTLNVLPLDKKHIQQYLI